MCDDTTIPVGIQAHQEKRTRHSAKRMIFWRAHDKHTNFRFNGLILSSSLETLVSFKY